MNKCKCSMTISVLGDGCRYCQPQEHIDRLADALAEETAMAAHAEELAAALYRVLNWHSGKGEFDHSGIPVIGIESFRHDMWKNVEAQLLDTLANYHKSRG